MLPALLLSNWKIQESSSLITFWVLSSNSISVSSSLLLPYWEVLNLDLRIPCKKTRGEWHLEKIETEKRELKEKLRGIRSKENGKEAEDENQY